MFFFAILLDSIFVDIYRVKNLLVIFYCYFLSRDLVRCDVVFPFETVDRMDDAFRASTKSKKNYFK